MTQRRDISLSTELTAIEMLRFRERCRKTAIKWFCDHRINEAPDLKDVLATARELEADALGTTFADEART